MVEGARLESVYTVKNRIEGSNPSPSANDLWRVLEISTFAESHANLFAAFLHQRTPRRVFPACAGVNRPIMFGISTLLKRHRLCRFQLNRLAGGRAEHEADRHRRPAAAGLRQA